MSGNLAKEAGRRGTFVYSARIRAEALVRVSMARGWLVAAGNAVRRRVTENLQTGPPDGLALVAGFLVGDTSQLSPKHIADLRRSGLSHYVAVSGGNVTLFLGALWILMWPVVCRLFPNWGGWDRWRPPGRGWWPGAVRPCVFRCW